MKRRGNHEGSIYKRADGRWVASITLGYESLKRTRKSFYGKSRAAVAKQLSNAISDHQKGLPVTTEQMTVALYLKRWLRDVIGPSDLKDRTKHDYADMVRLHLEPELGGIQLIKLAPLDIRAMLNRKRKAGLGPRRCQYIHAVLRLALGQAEGDGLVHRNVAKLVKVSGGPRVEIRPFTEEEARTFLAAVRDQRLEALYVTALTLGMRQGEILGLRWDDVDLDQGMLAIRRTLVRINGVVSFPEPKTERSKRVLWLPQITINALHVHRTRQLEERLIAGSSWIDTRLVFTTETGEPLRDTNVTKAFQKLLSLAGLRHQRFHDLRHAAASFLLAQGFELREIMGILGHSNLSLTADLYTHLMPAVGQQAAKRMDSFLQSV